ncbi:MAG: hypothetical protein JNM31_04615 [Flavobacteriales bacterium]|nr:hypothetical protein [Flavobacteriales bacterium]
MNRFLSILMFVLAVHGHAQIDSVFVELYHVLPDTTGSGSALMTYRIYVDLAPGHQLEMVYGDEAHELMIRTTTDFFNSTDPAKFGSEVHGDRLDVGYNALDTYITVGAASDRHWGIPRNMDRDGSVLHCPPYPSHPILMHAGRPVRMEPLCVNDGLLAADTIKDVVNFLFASSYLSHIRGSVLHTINGAWAVLGGTRGPTDENIILLAQLTTTGVLSFRMNLQIGTPDGRSLKFVSDANVKDGEIHHPDLFHGTLY